MKIIVDAMGGDNAPSEIVKGTVDAVKKFGIQATLVGNEDKINQIFEINGLPREGIEIVHAGSQVLMTDNSATVLREKKDTSMGIALSLLGHDQGDALVSAGSTGALLTGATLFVKRIKGIRRAALAPFIPGKNGSSLLIDCGANVECTPEYLLQFAYMGYFYVQKLLGIEKPRIGLVNNGTEETKGNHLLKETYPLLKKASEEGHIHFIGNIEGRDIMMDTADIILADGFTGNVILKTMEGAGIFFMGEIKAILMKNWMTKIAAMLLKDGFLNFKKRFDYKEVGGAPLLGIKKPIIKAHGSSDAKSFCSAIKQAITYTESGIIEMIEENIEHMTVMDGEQTD